MEPPPTAWRGSQAASRERYLAKFDAAEAARWATSVADPDAYLGPLAPWLRPGMQVLDAGAGGGTFTAVLARRQDLDITALEPAPAMLAALKARPELAGVHGVLGFCDAPQDRDLFPAGCFGAIASRQLANGLYDPLQAFRNWRHWLKPGGVVLLIDGSFGRDAWQGKWAEEVDELPLSANQSLALLPYLLEQAGFEVVARAPLAIPLRYLVVARLPG